MATATATYTGSAPPAGSATATATYTGSAPPGGSAAASAVYVAQPATSAVHHRVAGVWQPANLYHRVAGSWVQI